MSLTRLILKNLTLQGISQSVALSSGLIVSLILSRYLGKAGFGGFNYVFAYLYFWLAANDLGINTIVIRDVAKDETRAADIIGAMAAFRLVLGIVAWLGASAVALLTPLEPELRSAILIFSLILPLSAVNLSATIFQITLRFGFATVVEIVTRGSGLVLVLTAVALDSGLRGVFLALLAAEVIGAAVQVTLSRRLVRPRLRIDLALWRTVLRSSVPIGLTGLLVAVVNRIDFLMLERMTNLEQVGLYSVAYKVTNLFEKFPQLVAATLYPVMSKLASTDPLRLRRVYRKTVVRMAAVALPAGLLITWLAPQIIVVFGEQYLEAASALRVLVWSSVCLYLALTGGNLLISIGRERINLYILIAGAATNVVGNVFWIPLWGYVGAAMATVAAFGVILVMTAVAAEVCLRRLTATPPATY